MLLSVVTTPINVITIAAAVLMRDDQNILLVRKAGTQVFMQAGGKIEAGETALCALTRELHEELGLSIDAEIPEYIGNFSAPAANEPDHIVIAEIFFIRLTSAMGKVIPAAEIEQIVWVDPAKPIDLSLAPLTENTILPLCKNLLLQNN